MLADDQPIRQVDDNTVSSALPVAHLRPIVTKNLSQIIIERLAGFLNSSDLKPGQKIPSEKELMEIFGVGRSSIREALHSLVTLDLLESRSGKGYYVKEPPRGLIRQELAQFAIRESDFLDLMETREKLEPVIAEFAIQRVTSEDLDNLESIYSEIEQAAAEGKNLTFYTAKVHLGIAEAAHNTVLIFIMNSIIPLIVAKMRHASIPVEEDLRMHWQLIEGLKRGDVRHMKGLIKDHLRVMKDFYMDLMERWERAPAQRAKETKKS